MKITFLGTGKGGYPTLTRNCCAILLECGDGSYLIDAGAPVLDLMTRAEMPFEKVKAVFTTHMHGDHTAGLPAFLTACSWHYTDCSFDVFLTEERGVAAFREVVFAMDKVFHEDRIRLKKAEPGVLYTDENVTVTAIPTAHCAPYPSYAYVFEGEGKRVIFSGDLCRPDAPDFPVIALEEPSDAFVCELCHFTTDHIFPIIEKCPTKQVFFNHVGGKIVEETLAAVEEFAKTAPMKVVAPDDGDSYTI